MSDDTKYLFSEEIFWNWPKSDWMATSLENKYLDASIHSLKTAQTTDAECTTK